MARESGRRLGAELKEGEGRGREVFLKVCDVVEAPFPFLEIGLKGEKI